MVCFSCLKHMPILVLSLLRRTTDRMIHNPSSKTAGSLMKKTHLAMLSQYSVNVLATHILLWYYLGNHTGDSQCTSGNTMVTYPVKHIGSKTLLGERAKLPLKLPCPTGTSTCPATLLNKGKLNCEYSAQNITCRAGQVIGSCSACPIAVISQIHLQLATGEAVMLHAAYLENVTQPATIWQHSGNVSK